MRFSMSKTLWFVAMNMWQQWNLIIRSNFWPLRNLGTNSQMKKLLIAFQSFFHIIAVFLLTHFSLLFVVKLFHNWIYLSRCTEKESASHPLSIFSWKKIDCLKFWKTAKDKEVLCLEVSKSTSLGGSEQSSLIFVHLFLPSGILNTK